MDVLDRFLCAGIFPIRSHQGVCDTPLQFAATLIGMGKPCRVSGEHFPRWGNLAALRGNIFPGGETLPRSGGTFSQAGKPCRVPGEHFPRRENLAALRGNIFPSGETLPRSRGTFSLAGKPCHNLFLFAHVRAYAIRPYSFCGKLSTNFSYSLSSGRMRYAPTVFAGNFPRSFPVRPLQGVCDTPLHLFDNHQGFIE